jgi:hypothetical protein
MINNDYIQGYINALKTLETFTDHLIATYELEKRETLSTSEDPRLEPLQQVKKNINEIRSNYRDLIQRLNDGQKKERR